MSDRPDPTPEGVLLRAALKRSGLSAREAAKRTPISYGRWHQIVNGYQPMGGGVYHPVRDVPSETIARMARTVGVTPQQLEKAGRADAAAELRELEAPVSAELTGDQLDNAEQRAERLAEQLADALAEVRRLREDRDREAR